MMNLKINYKMIHKIDIKFGMNTYVNVQPILEDLVLEIIIPKDD